MDQPGAGSDALRRLAMQVGLYAGTFFAGALIAFLYSYMPLHNAKNWKIDYLEERIATKDGELENLTARLAALESDTVDRPDAKTFKLLQDELVTADKTVKRLEGRIAKLERRGKELEQSRNNWKAKHADAEKARVAAASAATAAAAGQSASPDHDAVPAAPAPDGGSIASGVTVAVGSRWRSPDGRADFDLVAIRDGKARVVPNASQLRPGAVPATRDVGAGDRFELDGTGDVTLGVRVRRVDGSNGIVIDVAND